MQQALCIKLFNALQFRWRTKTYKQIMLNNNIESIKCKIIIKDIDELVSD